MKANIRGTEIYFDVTGIQVAPEGNTLIAKPVLFLIHGGPGGNHINFKLDLLKLEKYAQLVFIDQRGCGFSKKTKKADYTLENNIEDIEALRKYLGLKKICILGVSYGGIVAQGYAIRYSKHLDKLILAVTAPSYRFIEEAKKTLKKIGTPQQVEICNKYLWKGNFPNRRAAEQYFKVMDPLYIYHYQTKKRKRPSQSSGPLKNIISHEALSKGFSSFLRDFDYIPQLKKITCPTLILAGKNDWICSPNQAKTMAKHIPHAKLKIFNQCGHAIALDAHEKYLQEISRFLMKK